MYIVIVIIIITRVTGYFAKIANCAHENRKKPYVFTTERFVKIAVISGFKTKKETAHVKLTRALLRITVNVSSLNFTMGQCTQC